MWVYIFRLTPKTARRSADAARKTCEHSPRIHIPLARDPLVPLSQPYSISCLAHSHTIVKTHSTSIERPLGRRLLHPA